jgi:hypothetical protein
VNFYGGILDSNYHVDQVSMGSNHTIQYHYDQTICAPTNTVVTVTGSATQDNTCACEVGYHNKVSTTTDGIVTESCTICPAGSTCSGGAAPAVACASNEYQDMTGQTVCKPRTVCSNGSEENTWGSTSEDSTCHCSAGHDTFSNNACTPCIAGKYKSSTGNDDACAPCLPGFYTNTLTGTGATIATVCAAGFYCAGGTAREIVCPAATTPTSSPAPALPPPLPALLAPPALAALLARSSALLATTHA